MNPLDQTPMNAQPAEQQVTPSVHPRKNVTPFVAVIILVVVLLGAWIVFRRSDDMTVQDETQQATSTTPTQDVDAIITDIYSSTQADTQTTVNASPTDFSDLTK